MYEFEPNAEVTESLVGLPVAEVERRAMERGDLRKALLKALGPGGNSIVQWSKNFTRYEELPTGRIRAHFEDGTAEDGDILVGAEGSRSQVQRQYLPHIRR